MRLALLVAALAVGCIVPDVDVAGHPCPCPDGFRCDAASQVCVAAAGGAGAGAGAAASGGGGGALGGGSAGGAGPCGGHCGTAGCGACPTVPVIDAGGFGVDAFEALREDYARFLADQVDPAGQGPLCQWNTTFAPHTEDDCAGYDLSMTGFPMTCVDWCDAVAFCAWAGKHLCGRIGGGGVPQDQVDDPATSEWFAACSAGGALAFPYGNTFDATLCNDAGGGFGGDVIGAGWATQCEGGYPGLFDMIGNAEEWEDACTGSADPATDNCALRGGAFWTGQTTARCAFDPSRAPDRNDASHDWGFRCCSTP